MQVELGCGYNIRSTTAMLPGTHIVVRSDVTRESRGYQTLSPKIDLVSP